ncbi:MAG: spore germination protein GerW family protein [Trueperaceae bacterium]|nr:spore germination protein GerW family protein [Trueperaceae bacterium]
MSTQTLLDTLANALRDIGTTKQVVGEPMQVGDATLIPVVSLSLGLGAGAGDGSDAGEGDATAGSGGGGGVRVEPTAFILLQNGEIDVRAVPSKGGALATLFEKAPDLVDRIARARDGGDADDGEAPQGAGDAPN